MHPSLLPLSHCYPGSKIESPQRGILLQVELPPKLPSQEYPEAVAQLLHPTLLPLSHCSPWSKTLSPQTGILAQVEGPPGTPSQV